MIENMQQICNRIQKMLFLSNEELRLELEDLYYEIKERIESEKIHKPEIPRESSGSSKALVVLGETVTNLEERLRFTSLELDDSKRIITLLERNLEDREAKVRMAEAELEQAKENVILARAERFSKVVDENLGFKYLDRLPDEERLVAIADIIRQKDVLVGTRHKIDAAIAELMGLELETSIVQLVIGNGHKRSYIFDLPYKLTITHLQTVVTVWMQKLKEALEQIQGE